MAMIRRSTLLQLGPMVCALLLAAPARADIAVSYHPLPGGTQRFDYLGLDETRHRLFIAHMGAGQVIVFDTRTTEVVQTLNGFPGATGITVAPDSGRVYVSVTGSVLGNVLAGGKIAVIDADTLRAIAEVPAGRFPDGSALVPGAGRLFVSDERGAAEIVIDTRDNHVLASIALDGEAGMSVYDPQSRRVYVNVQDRNELVAIDPTQLSIVQRDTLPKTCVHNHGLAVDAGSQRAYIGCDGNARVLAFDLARRAALATAPVGADPDVLLVDGARRRLYVASESGDVSLFSTATEALIEHKRIHIGEGAHTMALDSATGRVYVPVRNRGGKPALAVLQVDAEP